MSYRVKPEDVSEVVISWAEDSVGLGNGAWDCVDVQELCAAIINAAIEAGLLSPPCWVCRTQWGELNTAAAFVSRENAEKYKNEADRIEHWKGQAE